MSATRIDFLRPASRAPLGPWLFALGLVAAGLCAWQDRTWTAQRLQSEKARSAQLEAARLEAARRPPPPPPDRRLLAAAAEQSRPWLAALRSIETAAIDPVYLSALSLDSASGQLKIEAEAPSFDHALAFTQVLADGRTLPAASLASHGPAGPTSTAVKFTVVGQWRAP